MMLWTWVYRLRDAREGIARNAWASLATVLIVTLALLFFGGFLWLNTGIADLASILERQVQVRALVTEDTDSGALATQVAALPDVQDVGVVTGQETFNQLAAVFAGSADLQQAFPENPFPDSLSITVDDPEAAGDVVTELRTIDGVDEVIYGQGYAEPLLRMANGLQRGGLLLGTVFLVAAILMTTVAMHLAVLSRAAEIRIQQWMGATPWGVRSQFMLEGFLLGLFAAGVAIFLFLLATQSALGAITRLVPFGGGFAPPGPIAWVLLVAGPALGILGSAVASQRFVGVRAE